MDYWSMKAALTWQLDMGADEAIADTPVDRFAASRKETEKLTPEAAPASAPPALDPVAVAAESAKGAADLEALKSAMEAYDLCELKRGAKQLVFSDGLPAARVMIVGEAPGRDEDLEGRPFVGRAGQFLDLMFSHVGLARTAPDAEKALYITNILPWRPPQNRDPRPEEIAMMKPFLARHIELANPDVLISMGNHACDALLGRKGITRLRGTWTAAMGIPVLPMFHPAYLLRNPAAKREAWADLLSLKAQLAEAGCAG
ncbi:MAG: uracil-DNA glycosylase [Paracoccaceae bacterium]|nr:uracil-DNA glycosylase [Paracoccaceae bacterium]